MDPTSRSISQPELLENLAWVQVLARRLVSDAAAAEDVAQDTWVAALEHPPRRRSGAGLRAWLARVTRSMARKHREADARRAGAVADEGAEPSALDVVTRVARQKRIIEAVMALDEPDRTTVFLRYVDGLSAAAIARRRGEMPAAVRQRLVRARARLRGRLEREFDDDDGGWIRALAPLALLKGHHATTAGLAGLLGGALVSKTTVSIGVGVAVVAAGAFWFLRDGDAVASEDQPPDETIVADVPLVAPDEEEPATVLPPPADLGDPTTGRTSLPDDENLPGPAYALLDPEDRPLRGAHVVVCREGEVLAVGETDAEGSFATTIEATGAAQLLVLPDAWTPQIHDVPLTPERHEVRLRPGAVVAGWIVVSGREPATRIPLQLRSVRNLFDAEQELGITLEEAQLGRMTPIVMRAVATMDGSFRFDGLAGDWAGTLDLPVDYHLEDQLLAASDYRPCSVRLEGPVEDLRIEVAKRLVLTGRVVDFPKRQPSPVPDLSVNASIEYPATFLGQTHQDFDRTDEEGRFRIALRYPTVKGGGIWIHSEDGKFSHKVELEAREVTEDWDLGDIVLAGREGTQTIQLVVRDTAGDPVPGAVAATDATSPISAPTDEEGRTSIPSVLPGLSTIGVYRMGYQVSLVSVPAEPPEELEVVLVRGACLELQLLHEGGEGAASLVARLASSEYPYREASTPRNYNAYTGAGCSYYQIRKPNDEEVVARIYGLREGHVVLNDLVPGLPFHLRVEGKYGTTIQEQEIAPLRPEEHRRVEVVLEQVPRTLRGVVLDEAGQPLPFASVGVSHTPPDSPEGYSQSGSRGTNDDGTFEITNIYATHIDFSVRAEEYISFREPHLEVPVDGAPLEIRLTKGRAVTVIIEDEAGKGIPAEMVSAKLASDAVCIGWEVAGREGAYIMRGLPDHEVTITARVSGLKHERVHDPLVPELRIILPVFGQVEAVVHRFDDIAPDDKVGLWIVPLDGPLMHRRYAELGPDFTNSVRIEGVLPGHYEAVVQRYLGGYYEEARFEEMSARIRIVVVANETTRLEVLP